MKTKGKPKRKPEKVSRPAKRVIGSMSVEAAELARKRADAWAMSVPGTPYGSTTAVRKA